MAGVAAQIRCTLVQNRGMALAEKRSMCNEKIGWLQELVLFSSRFQVLEFNLSISLLSETDFVIIC